MKIHELLNQVAIQGTAITEVVDNMNQVKVFRNPSAAQVAALVKEHERVRGIEHDGMIAVWNGYDACHFQVEAFYGIPREEGAEFVIIMHDGHHEMAEVWLHKHGERLMASEAFTHALSGLSWLPFPPEFRR